MDALLGGVSSSASEDQSLLTLTTSSSSGVGNLAVLGGTVPSSERVSSRESSFGPSSEGRGRRSLPRPYDTLPFAGPIFNMDGDMLKWKSTHGWRQGPSGRFCQPPTAEEIRTSEAYEKSLEKAKDEETKLLAVALEKSIVDSGRNTPIIRPADIIPMTVDSDYNDVVANSDVQMTSDSRRMTATNEHGFSIQFEQTRVFCDVGSALREQQEQFAKEIARQREECSAIAVAYDNSMTIWQAEARNHAQQTYAQLCLAAESVSTLQQKLQEKEIANAILVEQEKFLTQQLTAIQEKNVASQLAMQNQMVELYRQYEQEQQSWKQELGGYSAKAEKVVSDLQVRISDLERQLQVCRNRESVVSDLERQLQVCRGRETDLEWQNKQLTSQCQNKDTELNSVKSVIHGKDAEMQKLRSDISQMQSSLEAIRLAGKPDDDDELTDKLADKDDEIQDLAEQLEEERNRRRDLQCRLDELTSDFGKEQSNDSRVTEGFVQISDRDVSLKPDTSGQATARRFENSSTPRIEFHGVATNGSSAVNKEVPSTRLVADAIAVAEDIKTEDRIDKMQSQIESMNALLQNVVGRITNPPPSQRSSQIAGISAKFRKPEKTIICTTTAFAAKGTRRLEVSSTEGFMIGGQIRISGISMLFTISEIGSIITCEDLPEDVGLDAIIALVGVPEEFPQSPGSDSDGSENATTRDKKFKYQPLKDVKMPSMPTYLPEVEKFHYDLCNNVLAVSHRPDDKEKEWLNLATKFPPNHPKMCEPVPQAMKSCDRGLRPKLESMMQGNPKLKSELSRYQRECITNDTTLSSLRMLSIFYAHFKVESSSLEVVNINHLAAIAYRGDEHADEFHGKWTDCVARVGKLDDCHLSAMLFERLYIPGSELRLELHEIAKKTAAERTHDEILHVFNEWRSRRKAEVSRLRECQRVEKEIKEAQAKPKPLDGNLKSARAEKRAESKARKKETKERERLAALAVPPTSETGKREARPKGKAKAKAEPTPAGAGTGLKKFPCFFHSKWNKDVECKFSAEECSRSHTVDFKSQEEFDQARVKHKERMAKNADRRATSAERRETGAAAQVRSPAITETAEQKTKAAEVNKRERSPDGS